MKPDDKTLSETNLQEAVDISMFGKKNVILDSQILSSLMKCARLTDFRFNHNFVSIAGKSNSLEVGSIVHIFLEYYYKNIIKGLRKEQAVQFAFAAAEMYIQGCKGCMDFISQAGEKPSCGHKANEFPGVKNTPRESEGYKTGWQHALDTCDQYIQFYRNDHWVPLEVETVKGEVLYEDDEIRIMWKAKYDLIVDTNQSIDSVDHKTMKQRRDTISLNNQFMGQCLLIKTRKVIIDKIGFQTSLKPEEKFTRPPVCYSAARLLEWQGETLPFYAKLLIMYAETGHFPPNYESCESRFGKCAFLGVCESDPIMREDELKRSFMVGPEWNPTSEDDD
jgi:hypothetical protein